MHSDLQIIEARSSADVRRLLEALPDWFGAPDAISSYAAAADDETYGSFLAVGDGKTYGLALVRRHFTESAELHLIAVAPEMRGRGIGRRLVEHLAASLAADGCTYLTVHTVGQSFEHAPYAETREFYRRAGFTPLEEHEGLDWAGPTLILVRALRI